MMSFLTRPLASSLSLWRGHIGMDVGQFVGVEEDDDEEEEEGEDEDEDE